MSRRRREHGDPARFAFPRPMKGEAQPDFSFSGLKTAVRQAATAIAPLTDQDVADICASFQAAVTDALRDRVSRSLARFKARISRCLPGRRWSWPAAWPPTGSMRATLEALCAERGFGFVAPPLALCTDNAAMIAWAGIERLRAGLARDGRHGFRAALALAAGQRFGAGRRLRPQGSQGMKRVSVLGGGAWGTALALTAMRAGHSVRLWAREPEAVACHRGGEQPALPSRISPSRPA